VESEPPRDDVPAEVAELGGEEEDARVSAHEGPLALPFARRDLERLRLVLLAQRRLREAHGPVSTRRSLAAKAYFEEAVRWIEIHGGEEGRELAALWRGMDNGPAEPDAPEAEAPAKEREGPRRRRRRRRRRPRSTPAPAV
jgi:hypothetical protein